MKKNKTTIVSANLTDLAIILYHKVNRIRPKGWFSKFVSEKLVEQYYKDFEKTILVEELNKKTKNRNILDVEIQKIGKRIKKINEVRK